MTIGTSMLPLMRALALSIIVALSSSFRVPTISHRIYSKFSVLKMSESSADKKAAEDMRIEITNSNYKEAFGILKRHPLLHLNLIDAQSFLNNLDSIDDDSKIDDLIQKKIDASNFIYKRCQRQNLLRGFGCVDKAYPEASTEITPLKLEELTGLSITSLTPKQRTNYWRLAGAALCASEYIVGSSLGIDPLYTIIPATFFLFGLDQLLYKGAYFESTYQTLFPEYRKKIVAHEAGHFLIAYLLGLPVSNCITSAMEARKYPEIRGQAGTLFNDMKLTEEMKTAKVTRSSLDRLSIVLMGGIAAEAMKFGNAEGGAVDEQELFALLTQVQPPWNLIRIQGQARWAVVQALLLIKEHQVSFDALYEALMNNAPVGDCIVAIEKNLPAILPSIQRTDEKKRILKENERQSLVKHIQRITYRVGGIDDSDTTTTISADIGSTPSGLVLSSSSSTTSNGSLDDDQFNINKEGYLIKPSSTSTTSSTSSKSTSTTTTTTAPTITPVLTAVPLDPEVPEIVNTAIQQFNENIKLLEQAASTGVVNITDQEAKAGGGIWLNGLQSYGKVTSSSSSSSSSSDDVSSSTTTTTTTSASNVDMFSSSGSSNSNTGVSADMYVFPKPVEGYEEKIQSLLTTTQTTENITSENTENDKKAIGSISLLKENRGFLWKKLNNQKLYNMHQVTKIDRRLDELKTKISTSSTTTTTTNSVSK